MKKLALVVLLSALGGCGRAMMPVRDDRLICTTYCDQVGGFLREIHSTAGGVPVCVCEFEIPDVD